MKRFLYYCFTITGLALYLTVQACSGNKDNNNNANQYPYTNGYNNGGQYCYNGQNCTYTNGGAGVPLLNGPALSSFSGGEMILNISGTGQAGQTGQTNYVTTANVNGTIVFQPGACGSAQGQFPIQGQVQWQSGYGGSIGALQGVLQVQGTQMQVSGAVWVASDPYNQGQQGYRLQGSLYAPACYRNITLQ
jgi:hypothetical protein